MKINLFKRNKVINKKYECELCGKKFIREEEYYYDKLLRMWRPTIYRLHDLCQKCIKANEILKKKQRSEWIKIRERLLKNKPIKYLNERRWI